MSLSGEFKSQCHQLIVNLDYVIVIDQSVLYAVHISAIHPCGCKQMFKYTITVTIFTIFTNDLPLLV